MCVLFGPQGPDFLSEELLLDVQRVDREKGTRIHLHRAQGDRETAQMMMRRRSGGRTRAAPCGRASARISFSSISGGRPWCPYTRRRCGTSSRTYVYAAQGSEVAMVVVDGRVLLEHNRLVTADEDAILADAQRYRAAIGADATEQFWKVNGTNGVHAPGAAIAFIF